ncbi:unnamed protein product, partial [marine sediment metagenome]
STTTVAGTTCTSTAHLLTAGMLVTDDTDACFEVASVTSVDIFEVDRAGASTGTQWQEVTPGTVAADAKGPDGWHKTTTLDILRQHSSATYTKSGSFYSLKVVKGAASAENVVWPYLGDSSPEATFVKRFVGRDVALGCWAYSTNDDDVQLIIHDSVGSTSSDYHTGTGWEWMEITRTVAAAATSFYIQLYFDGDSADESYISQPMLVFGTYIGSGNYVQPPGEIVYFEKDVVLTDYDTTGTSDTDAEINIEV